MVSTPMTQNMRGRLFPAAGVWGVSTAPQARRKGYCRQAMTSLLSTDREARKVFSNLYPFRESFYGRLGYVAYPLTTIARFSPQSLAPVLKMKTSGEIRLRHFGEAYDDYRAFLARLRKLRHGMAFFDFGDRARANQDVFWSVLAVFDGETEGLMIYRINGDEPTKFVFSAIRFYYLTHRARYLLLNWIARHIDQAEKVELRLPPDEHPETWLMDFDIKVECLTRPAMSRVLDVEKMGGLEVGEGSFSAKVIDPTCPWNEGVWRFESKDGILEVNKGSTPQCELSIQGLTALVLGTNDPQDFVFRGWGNPDADQQSIQRSVFTKQIPFMHEMF